jgi:23S rRNA pseudouridine1911/1915/1917 synthase
MTDRRASQGAAVAGASTHSITVTEDSDGVRLDRFVVSVLPQQSRSQIQRLIKDGLVKVGGRDAKSNQAVKAGQTVTVDIPEPAEAEPRAEALPLPIVYQDRDVVVVDKPAGMVVHPAAGHANGTLVNALLHHVDDLSGVGGEKRPGIVHRLDRGTSGLMVVAKHDAAHEALSRQFHDRAVEKEYVALVWGEVMAGRRIDAPIGRDPGNRKRMSAHANKRPEENARARRSREAVTRIVGAEHFGRTLTLARVAIHTGRTHQIRVHLSAIGHPVVGDSLYGGVHRRVPGDLRAVTHLDRPFLHAAKLAFAHPMDGRRMEFTSELPPDLQHVLDELVVLRDTAT